jgi:carbonic anhydrase
MQLILEGLRRYQDSVHCEKQELFCNLAKGQSPEALFITCADSRVDPGLLTQLPPGELFVLRNAGNIVPAYGRVHGGEAATIEYAISVLKIPNIIICGHAHCGAMAGLLRPSSVESLPAVKSWLSHAQATREAIDESLDKETDPIKQLEQAVRLNVLVQLENLKTHPCIRKALAEQQLTLHGWVYDFEHGSVDTYDPIVQDFVHFDSASDHTLHHLPTSIA